jgi:hypothetical protein
VDDAFDWLERGYAERVNQMVIVERDPAMDILRGEARFADLLTRVAFSR